MFVPSRYSVLTVIVVIVGFITIKFDNKMNEEKYSVKVEWFDDISSRIRTFTFFYFPLDQTVEMFDIQQKKTFLRRSHCETVSETDLFIGNSVMVFGRELKILDYLNEPTRVALQRKAERTYAMLKPEVISHMGKILSMIEERGFRFNRMMLTKMSSDTAAEFYKEHQGKEFYNNLVQYISSGPVLAMELLAPSAVSFWRTCLGPTNPDIARTASPNSVRAHFGTDTTFNAAHGSDSSASALRELALVFNTLSPYRESSGNTTLCIVKPHILREGKLGALVSYIQEKGFKVDGLKLLRLSLQEAEQFFIAYKGVWTDFQVHVKEFSSGASVALVIGSDVTTFRNFVGPFDPEVARKIDSSSLRAKFGKEPVYNSVHCTDLPSDGNREVQFFFP